MESDDDLDEDDTFFRIEEASDDSYDSDEIKVDIRQFNGAGYDDEEGLRQATEMSRRAHEEEKYKRIEDIAIRKSIRAERRRRRAAKREEEAILATIANSIAEEASPAYAQYSRVAPVQKIGRASSAVYTDHIKYASSAIKEHRAASAMNTDHIKYASSALQGKYASSSNLHEHHRHPSHAHHNASMYSSPRASAGGSYGAASPPLSSPGEPIIINTLTMEALELHNMQTAVRKQPIHSNVRRDAELEAALRISEIEVRNQYPGGGLGGGVHSSHAPLPPAAAQVGSPVSSKSAYDLAMEEAIRRSREEAERQEMERALALSQQKALLSSGGRVGGGGGGGGGGAAAVGAARVGSPAGPVPLTISTERPGMHHSSSTNNVDTNRGGAPGGLRSATSRGKSAYDLELEEALRLSKLEQKDSRGGYLNTSSGVTSNIPITPTSVSSAQLKAAQAVNSHPHDHHYSSSSGAGGGGGAVPSSGTASTLSKNISTPIYRSESPAMNISTTNNNNTSNHHHGNGGVPAPLSRSSTGGGFSLSATGAVRDPLSRPSTGTSTPYTPVSAPTSSSAATAAQPKGSSAYRSESPHLQVKEDSPPESGRPVPPPAIHVDYSRPPAKIIIPPSPEVPTKHISSTPSSTVPAPPSATQRSQTAPQPQTTKVSPPAAAAAVHPVLPHQNKSAPSMMGMFKRFASTNSPTKPVEIVPSRPVSARNATAAPAAAADTAKVSRVGSLDSMTAGGPSSSAAAPTAPPPALVRPGSVQFTSGTVDPVKPVSPTSNTGSRPVSLQRNKSSAEQSTSNKDSNTSSSSGNNTRPSSGKFFGLLKTRSTSPVNESSVNPSPDRGSKGKSFFSSFLLQSSSVNNNNNSNSNSHPPPIAPVAVTAAPATAGGGNVRTPLPLPRKPSNESNASSREETTLDDPAVKRFMELRAQKKFLLRKESLRLEILEQARSMHVPSAELEDYVSKVLEEREALESSKAGIAGATNAAAMNNVNMTKIPSDSVKMSAHVSGSGGGGTGGSGKLSSHHSGSGKGLGSAAPAAAAAPLVMEEHKAEIDEMVGVQFNELNDSKEEVDEDESDFGEVEEESEGDEEEVVDEEQLRRQQEQEEAELLRKQLQEDAEQDRRNVEKRQAEQYEMYKQQRDQQEKQHKAEQALLEQRRTEQRVREQQQAQQFEIFQREQMRLAEEAAEQQRVADEQFARNQYEQIMEQERQEAKKREQQLLEQQQREADQLRRKQEAELYEQQQKEKKRLELVHQENMRQEQLQRERDRAERDRLQREKEMAEIQKLRTDSGSGKHQHQQQQQQQYADMGMMMDNTSPGTSGRVGMLRQEFQRNNSLSPQSSFYQAPTGTGGGDRGLQRSGSGSPLPGDGLNSLQRRQQLQSQYLSAIKGGKSDSQSTVLSNNKHMEKAVSDVTSGSSQATSSPSTGVPQLAPMTSENLQQVQSSLYSSAGSKTTSFTSTSGSFYAQREASVSASVDAKKYPHLAETLKYKDPSSFQETQYQQEQKERQQAAGFKQIASNEQLLHNLQAHYNLQPNQHSPSNQSPPSNNNTNNDLTIRLPGGAGDSPPQLQRLGSGGFQQSNSDKMRTPTTADINNKEPRRDSFGGGIQYDNSPHHTVSSAAAGAASPGTGAVGAPSSARYGTTQYVKPVSPKNADIASGVNSSPQIRATPAPQQPTAPAPVPVPVVVTTPKSPVVDPQTALTSAMALLSTAMAAPSEGPDGVDKNAAMIAAVSLIKQAMSTTDSSNPQNAALNAALTLLTGIQASNAAAAAPAPQPVAPAAPSQLQQPALTKQYSAAPQYGSPNQTMLPPPAQQQQQQQMPQQYPSQGTHGFVRKTSESNMDFHQQGVSAGGGYDPNNRLRTGSISSYSHAPSAVTPSAGGAPPPYGMHRTSSREHMEWNANGEPQRAYYPPPQQLQQQPLPSPAAYAAQQQHQRSMYAPAPSPMYGVTAPANTPSNYHHPQHLPQGMMHDANGGGHHLPISPTRSASMNNMMAGPSLAVRDAYGAQHSHSQSMYIPGGGVVQPQGREFVSNMSIEISGSRDDPMYGSLQPGTGGYGGHHSAPHPYYQQQQPHMQQQQQPSSARNAAFPPSGKTPTMYGQQQQQQHQQQQQQMQMRPPINTFSTDSYDRYQYPPQQQQQQYPNLPRGQSSPMRVQRPGEVMSSGRPSEASSDVSSDVSSTNTPVGRTISRVQSQTGGAVGAVGGPAAPSSPQEVWTCSVCTLKNNPNFLSCEACRSVRIR